MNKIRYVEKNYLCKYDLSEEFFQTIGLEVLDVTPLRKLFLLSTNKGRKILKRIDFSEERLEFIQEAVDYIGKNYPCIVKFDTLRNGKKYIKWNDDLYVILDIIEGREACSTNPIELDLCTRALGKYHIASKGIRGYFRDTLEKNITITNVMQEYEDGFNNLKSISKLLSIYSKYNEFDSMLVKNIDGLIGDARKAIDMLRKSNYMKMIEADESIVLCHNDLVYHNFIIYEGIVSLLDFDYSSLNLKCYDVSDLLMKWIKNADYDIEKGKQCLTTYNDENPLSMEEKELIYIDLLYPREVINIVVDYYFRRKDWEEGAFVSRLESKLDREVYRKEFIQEIL